MGKLTNRFIAVATLMSAMGIQSPVGARDSSLLGTAWLAEQIGGRDGAAGVRSTLEFGKSGQVGGTSGCNQYFGPVSLAGDGIAFGNLASTRKMCPDAEMDQEQRFLQALSAAERLVLSSDGQALVIYADGSEPVLQFTRIVDK